MEKRNPEKALTSINMPKAKRATPTCKTECDVTLHFNNTSVPNVRKKVADLLVVAFEKEIGVKEKT